MRRAALALLAATALAPTAAGAMEGHGGTAPAAQVSMGFAAVTPSRITVLTGDTVRFTNDSVRVHTVTADDGSFDSGRITTGDSFERTLTAPGAVAYHCTLHPTVRGTVEVRDVLLDAPRAPAAPGRPYPLHGRAAAAPGTAVVLEADTGTGFTPAAAASVGEDGGFTASVRPPASGSWRAVVGDATSDAVPLLVLDHRVALTRARRGGRDVLTATVTPPDPGATVVLQLRIPERFGWWPVQRTRLDGRSQARFIVRTRRRLPARVRLTLPDGATPLADSRVVHVGVARRG